MTAPASVTAFAIPGLPRIRPGDDLGALLADAIAAAGLRLVHHDVVAVCQKVVSKSEGRVVDLRTVTVSPFAAQIAASAGKDPRAVEVILGETSRIVKMADGHLICETQAGWVCANAGVDESNGIGPDVVTLLPLDADASAERLRAALAARAGVTIGVVVTDTFGRPWRDGLVEVALGTAGIGSLLDLRGRGDLMGRALHHTVIAVADEIAATAGLLMEKDSGVAAVLVRGYDWTRTRGAGRDLVRPRAIDLFR
jgi:coenzyme F420-0:L-glutamate ligase/coenzyme F420-1:gamma-L-glutamate ligase